MKQRWRVGLVAGILSVVAVMPLSAADKGVTLIGVGYVPATDLDKSGLNGQICMRDDQNVCIDKATLGGFGSALTFTGHDDVFVGVPDRGPFDGRTDTPYLDRFNFFYMKVDPAKPFPNIKTVLLDTRFLRNEDGVNFVGDAYAFANNERNYLRFDPEGVRLSRDGTFFISDEYGPFLFEFDRQGHLLRRIPVPERFLIANPTGDVDDVGPNSFELYPNFNTSGRQANRGMEGLAITPDGRKLVGIMQNALIQDHGLNSNTPPGRVGLNNRIFTYDLATGEHHEYVYMVDAIGSGRGVNEMLAINDHEFLVLERDNKSLRPTPPNAPDTPVNKKIYKIDLNKANLTDVSGMDSLPAGASGSIVPVDKKLIVNLIDTDYKVEGGTLLRDAIAEKIEGLAWGPDLPDGRHVLYVISDNDLFTGNEDIPGGRPTQIFAFAIDSSAAGADFTYQPQQLPGPFYPPGQVKKQVK